jgi:fatty acid synthase subunit alpha
MAIHIFVVMSPTAPQTKVLDDGTVQYSEVARAEIRNMKKYVMEMRRGSHLTAESRQQQDVVLRTNWTHSKPMNTRKARRLSFSLVTNEHVDEVPMQQSGNDKDATHFPYIHMKRRHGQVWIQDMEWASIYFASLEDVAMNGIGLTGKVILLVGCGKGSGNAITIHQD